MPNKQQNDVLFCARVCFWRVRVYKNKSCDVRFPDYSSTHLLADGSQRLITVLCQFNDTQIIIDTCTYMHIYILCNIYIYVLYNIDMSEYLGVFNVAAIVSLLSADVNVVFYVARVRATW